MNLVNRLLYWFTGRLPCRIISDDGKPYLERYYLGTLLGVRFYIHRFVGSDPARGLHDHPWPWARSIVLSGWYFEERRTGTRRVRWFNKLTGDSFHRVVLPQQEVNRRTEDGCTYQTDIDAPCWTLFFHRASYTKPWGFLRDISNGTETIKAWVPHNYPKDGTGTPGAWWNEKPIGKLESRRLPL